MKRYPIIYPSSCLPLDSHSTGSQIPAPHFHGLAGVSDPFIPLFVPKRRRCVLEASQQLTEIINR